MQKIFGAFTLLNAVVFFKIHKNNLQLKFGLILARDYCSTFRPVAAVFSL